MQFETFASAFSVLAFVMAAPMSNFAELGWRVQFIFGRLGTGIGAWSSVPSRFRVYASIEDLSENKLAAAKYSVVSFGKDSKSGRMAGSRFWLVKSTISHD